MSRVLRPLLLALALPGCSATELRPQDATRPDTGVDADPIEDSAADMSAEPAPDVSDPPGEDAAPPFDPDASYPHFCDLPGSVQYTDAGRMRVPDGASDEQCLPGVGVPAWWCFLHLEPGFCAHYFGNIAGLARTVRAGGNVRQLRFAPNGDLFVASPTTDTTGGGVGGVAAVLVLPDDNGDGLADNAIRFVEAAPSTQGMMFADGYFYYQDTQPGNLLGTLILRAPYQSGDRKLLGPPEQVLDTSTYYASPLHWPKTLDQADDGTIYVAIGSDQNEVCEASRQFKGGIVKIDGSPHGAIVSKGFRNPIAVRCQRGHNLCFASELAKDYSADEGGREKLVPIRPGDDWGFPCCATRGVPHLGITPTPDCSSVTPEDVSFLIGHTPFSFDFERGKWPAPYTGSVFAPLHGAAGGWNGARIVAIETDPATGRLKPGTNLDSGISSGAMTDFATGWDDNTHLHGRPAAIEFASDGRMFIGNDNNGDIFWVAPLDLPRGSP